ncbi:MAG: hypothetical protein MESAZ_00932 [Saezia sanguinis]
MDEQMVVRIGAPPNYSGADKKRDHSEKAPEIGQEAGMSEQIIAQIEANPDYIALRKKRNLLGGSLTLVVLVIYYGFISLIAFDKEFLAKRIGEGVTTIGVPIGLGVIVVMIILTAFYVRQANRSYDGLIEKIKSEIQQ